MEAVEAVLSCGGAGRRDAELHRLGFSVLRFGCEQVVHQRTWWLGVVADVLARSWPVAG